MMMIFFTIVSTALFTFIFFKKTSSPSVRFQDQNISEEFDDLNFIEDEDVVELKDDSSEEEDKNELGYLNLVSRVIEDGDHLTDRTGVGCRFLVGEKMVYDLGDSKIPLFTHRKISFDIVLKELLFFLKGETDTKKLEDAKVNIWKGNSSLDFLKSRNLDYSEGDIGPMYGFQWRFFGAKYDGAKINNREYYRDKGGFDQIASIIDDLRNNPSSRRLLLTAFDPSTVDQCVLPPCHYAAQFIIRDGFLDCVLNQRSCDMILGCPVNVASYAILTRIMCHYGSTNHCKLSPGNLVHFIGHCHVYDNHIDTFKKNERKGLVEPPPTLLLVDIPESFEDLQISNFKLDGYAHNGIVKYDMAV